MITNIDILRHLKEKMTGDDGGASSHWRHYHQLFDIDEQLNVNTTGMLGFGDGKKPYSMLTRPIHYLLQRKFRKMIPDNATFRQIYEIAKNNTKRNNSRFSIDVVRQVLTLANLKTKGLIEKDHVAIVIGDGFGCLSSLLIQSGIAKKVILINLTKTLFVDVRHMIDLPEFKHDKAVTFVENKADAKKAMKDDAVKIITLEATSSDLLNVFVADLAFNIASMQEMDMEYIEKYFTEMRKIAKKMDIHFYCCNREQKYLPDGTSIVLDAYPWASDDTVYFSEMCPWHQEFYRITPPFYFNYDGPVRHSFTKLSKSI